MPPEVAPAFEQIEDFSGGLAAVRTGNRWGFINAKGEVAVPLRYTQVGRFSQGFARARK